MRKISYYRVIKILTVSYQYELHRNGYNNVFYY